MIGLLNYGLGNINAFSNILKNLNIEFKIPENEDDILTCDKFILPGVGSFDEAVTKLKSKNYFEILEDDVIKKKKFILGICVGMQIFLNNSEEGSSLGLGWIDGEVKKFNINKLRVPHIGWNKIKIINKNKFLEDIEDHEFYFLHSYYCEIKSKDSIITTTNYNIDFCSAFISENIFGIQFHPEKSHDSGIKLINNFAKI
jgi:glutamine amidotransferase